MTLTLGKTIDQQTLVRDETGMFKCFWEGTREEAESVVTAVNEHPHAIEMLRGLISHWRQLPGYAIEQSPGHADTAHNLFMQNFVKEVRALLKEQG